MKPALLTILLLASAAPIMALNAESSGRIDKLTYHHDRQRTGWNDRETVLTPSLVSSDQFGAIWESPQLDGYKETAARLYASPLYVDSVEITTGAQAGKRLSVVYAVTSTGYAYAINASDAHGVAPGTILWRTRLTASPCGEGEVGNLSTPIIDPKLNRMYVTSCDTDAQWRAHAIDLGSGAEQAGWPASIRASTINRPGINRNGTAQFPETLFHWNRGALNLSPDGSRLYVTFGKDGQSGWLVAVDTRSIAVASAFSTTAVTEEIQGGMWASGGPAIDDEARIYLATGASYYQSSVKKAGIPGVYPNSEHSWGQSILQLSDTAGAGFSLVGTYTPFNYCQTAAADIDLASSGAVVITLPSSETATPKLVALGGAKQGNLYLLDRSNMPGSLVKRPACSTDPETDRSLLAPEPQPQFGKRGPLNVFGPYADDIGMLDQAKSRSTAAYFADGAGGHFLFLTGSAKAGADYSTSVPPALAKIRLVTAPGQNAFPRIEGLETTQTMVNPGSPIVTSNGSKDAIVWVLDPNVPRTAALFGNATAKPVLYAFDATTLKLLWKTAANELHNGGKYNEPTVVNGMVLVGTDRIQAFGPRKATAQAQLDAEGFESLFDGHTLNGWKGAPSLWSVRDGAITGETFGPVGANTFLYSDRTFGDFELRLKYRFLTAVGNSGAQVRSEVVDPARYSISGYQANIVTTDAGKRFGMFVDEGRYDLAYLGEKVSIRRLDSGIERTVLGTTNPSDTLLKAARPYPEWNDYVVIAYGDRLINALNGYVLADITDPAGAKSGVLGFQIHNQLTMGVQFKDVRIKPLRSFPDIAGRLTMAATPASGKPSAPQFMAPWPTSAPAKAAATPPKQAPAKAAPARQAAPAPQAPPARTPVASSAAAPAKGAQLFQQKCAGCHTSGMFGVPSRAQISALPKPQIIEALTNGKMKPMASGLTKEQIDQVATHLKASGK